MWAIFFLCLSEEGLPGGWERRAGLCGVVLAYKAPDPEPDVELAEGPGQREPAAAPVCLLPLRGIPACPCCYYSQSEEVEGPEVRTPGWFWSDIQESWVWWHGHSPHQDPEEFQRHNPRALQEGEVER